MVKRFLFNIGEVVMFVISSNPSTISRMKARSGGFFKGTVVRENRSSIYIKPLNKEFMDRMKNTSFYSQAIQVKDKFITRQDLTNRGWSTPSDLTRMSLSDVAAAYKLPEKYVKKHALIVEYLSIPKKQVEHWLGEKRRLNDALDKLRQSGLVKDSADSQKKKTKTQKWVYNLR